MNPNQNNLFPSEQMITNTNLVSEYKIASIEPTELLIINHL